MATAAASPTDNDGNGRKRVCKACDRCRLKKSKCDGSSPCGRCQADNAICVFGERRKAHDKIYPKGANAVIADDSYVEMLEQQQTQLVTGLQELYAIVISNAGWKGAPLKESVNGHPFTHDILERLGALKMESKVGFEAFEEDFDVLRQKLASETDSIIPPRQGSKSSSYHSQIDFPEIISPQNYFSESFHPLHPFPLTPPIHSPHEEIQPSLSPTDSQNRLAGQAGLDTLALQSQRTSLIHQQSSTYNESLDFLSFDPSPNFDTLNPMEESTSSCLSILPWLHDDLGSFGLKTSDA